MSKEEFIKIVSKKYRFSKTEEEDYIDNKRVYQYRITSKGDYPYLDLLWDLNCVGNYVFTNKEGDRNLAALYYYGIFTEEQWDELLPHIFYRNFNKDFNTLTKKVLPLFRKIKVFYADLPSEFWQGIFSSFRYKGEHLEDCINYKKNGKFYCNTLLEIYPYFKEFLDKWECGKCTLDRFIDHNGPYRYKGILIEDLRKN